MATIQQLKTQIKNVNALGKTNLAEKGVKLPDTATTYNIMQAIAEIVGSSGSGTEYTSIVYNTDNTVTLTDTDGAVHTMSCTYEGDKLIGVTYDGKAVELTYNGDALVKVGKTAVDLANAKTSGGASLDHTVTFTVDGEPYEIVSVKAGNSVNAPSTAPRIENLLFIRWNDTAGELVRFPFTPAEDTTISALFKSRSNVNVLYERFGFDKNSYPYVCFGLNQDGSFHLLFNQQPYSDDGTQLTYISVALHDTSKIPTVGSQDEIVDAICNLDSLRFYTANGSKYYGIGAYEKFYTNCVRTYSSGIVVEYLT